MNADLHLPDRRHFSFSYKRVRRAHAGACTLCFALLLCLPVWGQLGSHSPAPITSQPEVPQDTLGRTTPRGTALGFLIAARRGDDELAAQYLNTQLRGRAAADLAHQLFVVLDRRLPARLRAVSDNPEGSQSDSLRPDQEILGTIASDNGNVDIIVERVTRGKSGPLWLFSSETLDAIPDLYREINVASVGTILPDFLTRTQFAGIALFEWLAVFVGMPLFFLATALLNRLLSPLIGYWRRRLRRKPDLPNGEVLPIPIRLFLLAGLIRWLLVRLGLPLLARQFWLGTSSILVIAGCVWVVILLNDRLEEYFCKQLPARNLSGANLMLGFVRRVIDVLVVCAGLLVTLYYFGVNLTATLAGLGVGGIAIALAAQKTLENVIGGVSLIFDRAMSVGDTLKVGDILGTVDEIGLRSTRIRTRDRTVVRVPNGQIANMSLENLSLRDKFWLHPILSLNYGTTSPQMSAVLDSIRSMLKKSRSVEGASVRVNLLGFGPYSLEVEVFAYILASNWTDFLALQETLLLQIMECIESEGVQIALPSQTVFLSNISTEAGVEGLRKVPAPSRSELAAKSA